MSQIKDEAHRAELLNRLKRAEGQLRGVQRMINEGDSCFDIAGQLSAVRRALDSAIVRMTACYLQQEIEASLGSDPSQHAQTQALIDEVRAMLTKLH